MGSGEKGFAIRRRKWVFFCLCSLMVFFLSGCQRFQTSLPFDTTIATTESRMPRMEISASSALITRATVTPSLTSTSTPTQTLPPSPTPNLTLLLSKPHSDFMYVRPITTQHITGDSIICSFELDKPGEGYLFYWSKEGGLQGARWIALQKDVSKHVLEIEGLTPGKEYEIAVGLLSEHGEYLPPMFMGSTWDPIRVRTLRKESWPLVVGVLGDAGFGESLTTELAEKMATYDLDFVLHTGDIVYRAYDNEDVQEAYLLKYYQTYAPILKRLPLYPVPGNHEYDDAAMVNGIAYYFSVFPPLNDSFTSNTWDTGYRHWYAIELGPIQFLMLDSQLFWRGEGRYEQTAWLEEQLQEDRFQVSIPVFHVPPYTSGLHHNDGILIQRDWIPLFEATPVPLVLSGHDHNYQRISLNGIAFVITGGGSSVLYPMGVPLPQNRVFASVTHFVLLEFYSDQLILSAITLQGEILDQITLDYLQKRYFYWELEGSLRFEP